MNRACDRVRVVLVVALLAATVGCGTAHAAPGVTDDGSMAAIAAGERFLDTYARDDGRVVRLDQDGDTVSEGQAYGMLVAAALGDEARFRAIWSWTAEHMQRADGLLGWRWAGGRMVDTGAASDADLITAWALGLAGKRFADPSFTDAAVRIGDAVISGETVPGSTGRTVVAGPWAVAREVVNPSYLVVGAMSQLWWSTDQPGWSAVASASRAFLSRQMAAPPHLPTDWAGIDASSTDAPDGSSPRFSYDAGRVLVQLAMDCDDAGRRLAASAWPFFASTEPGDIVAAYSPGGQPLTSSRHPIALVAAAAAAHAAGDEPSSRRLLDAAAEVDGRAPTYYGSAWIAISRLVLDTHLLGGCG